MKSGCPQKNISGHCGVCLSTVPFQRNIISQGTARGARGARGASPTLLHTNQFSVENTDLALPNLSGFLVFKEKWSVTFISLDAKTTETKI